MNLDNFLMFQNFDIINHSSIFDILAIIQNLLYLSLESIGVQSLPHSVDDSTGDFLEKSTQTLTTHISANI